MLNLPASGQIIVNKNGVDEPTRFLTAPLEAQFDLQPNTDAKIGQNYILRDEAGTELHYRVTKIEFPVWGWPRVTGVLVGTAYAPSDMISVKEHDEKLSASIDLAFEAGRQHAEQENREAIEQLAADMVVTLDGPANVYVRFADGQLSAFLDIGAYSEIDGELSLETTVGSVINVHPSWRSYEFQAIPGATDEDEDDDVELINPLSNDIVDKGEADACTCGACEAAREEPAASKPIWKPRYGPVGNRLDDE
ncbi:hypothetical protein EVC20_017 [Rhizobium phage RHph_Y2_17_1]|nr:hypothetical protein EVC19_017 [Rhizobium phage RHph_Y2_11]QIG75756.1 hypothetical protein EVC20_017 [Rhizobium phage RHph_Y2_17_1]